MKNKLLLYAAVAMALVSIAATVVVKISQFPNTTAAANGDLFLLASGSTNKNISWAQLRQQIGTNPPTVTVVNVAFVTNAYITFLTNINQYVTNQYVQFSFVTNFYAISSTVINQTNVTLYSTNNFLQFVTNNYTTVNNDITVKGNATMNIINSLSTSATNGFYVGTNAFAGPTNTVNLANQDQYYATFTPVEVTGFVAKSNHVVEGVILTLTNASTTNVLVTIPVGLKIPERTNQVTLSNASQGMLSIKYSPLAGTNGVFRQF